MKKFGTIQIKLKEILELKGITRYKLAKAIHVYYPTVNKWYHNDICSIDLNILAKICYVLECSPKDILKYEAFSSPSPPEDF